MASEDGSPKAPLGVTRFLEDALEFVIKNKFQPEHYGGMYKLIQALNEEALEVEDIRATERFRDLEIEHRKAMDGA